MDGDQANPKEKRLQSLARRAGDLLIKAMDAGLRDRAYHFMRRMYRMQGEQATAKEEQEARRG